MTRPASARRRVAGVALVLGCLALSTTGVLPAAHGSAAATVTTPLLQLTVDHTTDLTDGQEIEVHVKPAPGVTAQALSSLSMRICTSAVASSADLTNRNICPIAPYSAAADSGTSSNFYQRTDVSEAFGWIQAGIGTATQTITPVGSSTPVTYSATCDPDNPCRLVVSGVALLNGGVQVIFDNSTVLTYATPSSVPGCTGFDPNAITLQSPDRMAQAWSRWTGAQCVGGVGHKATSRSAFVSETDAVASFASGTSDVALSATGYRSPSFDPATKRPAIPVPLALNATVLAVGGGHVSTDKTWPQNIGVPFTDVKLTDAEFAAIIGYLNQDLVDGYGAAIRARNPELGPGMVTQLGWTSNGAGSMPLAAADGQATSLFATEFAKAKAPDVWKIPALGPYGGTPGQARGVDASLATADPSFQHVLNLFTGRPALQKFLYSARHPEKGLAYGVFWVLTDLATARQLGLVPVALQNSSGNFVTPTPESLAAAVPSLAKAPDGTLRPDPTAVQATDAYPLTYVEYALAPRDPLKAGDGTARADSQKLLTSWLTQAITAGQADLPTGLVPLTADLKAAAAKVIPKVGAGVETPTKPTGPGTKGTKGTKGSSSGSGVIPPIPPSGAGYDVAPIVDGAASGAGSLPGGAGVAPDRSGSVHPPDDASRQRANDGAKAARITLPPFLGVRAVQPLLAPLSLALLLVLMVGGSILTAGGRRRTGTGQGGTR